MTVKEYVAFRKDQLKEYCGSLSDKPKLVIIQLNEDEASNAYVKGKIKDLAFIGAESVHVKLSVETTEEELMKVIDEYNRDDSVDGILVQMPLPRQINEEHVKLAITPAKDVDGFHPLSSFVPCTPKGIMDYMKAEGIVMDGKNALVIGRSNIVGRPMAEQLLRESATVTIAHSHTSREDMARLVKNADIIVVAVGKNAMLNSSYEFKPEAVVIDVGINRIDGKLHGDAEPGLPVALQTPVPGGVGLLTRVSLLENLILSYQSHRGA